MSRLYWMSWIPLQSDGTGSIQNFSVLAGQLGNLSTYFKYPQEVRRLIYTANAIEGLTASCAR